MQGGHESLLVRLELGVWAEDPLLGSGEFLLCVVEGGA